MLSLLFNLFTKKNASSDVHQESIYRQTKEVENCVCL